jgi:hypothetical protein
MLRLKSRQSGDGGFPRGDQELVHGYATSRESAQIDGDDALFKLLSLGAQ